MTGKKKQARGCFAFGCRLRLFMFLTNPSLLKLSSLLMMMLADLDTVFLGLWCAPNSRR